MVHLDKERDVATQAKTELKPRIPATTPGSRQRRSKIPQGSAKRPGGTWGQFRADVLGRSVAERINFIRAGTDAINLLGAASELGVAQDVVFDIVGVPRSTAKRKISAKGVLDASATERLARLAIAESLAEGVFGDLAKGRAWLRTSCLGLSGATPISMLDTEFGAREVSRVLNAIAYGGAV
jgi:putative toxin-antitoxin system antitoxin component (TIGR02293 family)